MTGLDVQPFKNLNFNKNMKNAKIRRTCMQYYGKSVLKISKKFTIKIVGQFIYQNPEFHENPMNGLDFTAI